MTYEESREQIAFVEWCRWQGEPYSLIFAVENEGKKTPQAGARAKAMGKRAGVSDLILLYPTAKYHGLCIEMKASKGRQSDSQKDFEAEVIQNGYKYCLCHSCDEAIQAIKNYVRSE